MSNELDNLLDGFEETQVRTTESPDGSLVEISWRADLDTLTIRVVAGAGRLALAGQSDRRDQVVVVLVGGAGQAFWESLQRRQPPADDPFSGPGWPPQPSL